MLSYILKKIVVNLLSKRWLNPFLTFWFNFYFLPFKQAVHLPVYIYGWPRFLGSLSTKIQISTENVYRRMIIINQDNESSFNGNLETEFVLNGSAIIFRGSAYIGCGCRIMMYDDSTIIFGNGLKMANQTNVASCAGIEFGNNVFIGHCNQIFDTNFHYLYDRDTKTVRNNRKKIKIGDYSWITNHCTLMKGVQLPAYTIVASNSVINKNLTTESYTIWGNNRIIKTNVIRVFNLDIEGRISSFFKSNDQPELYLDESDDILTRR